MRSLDSRQRINDTVLPSRSLSDITIGISSFGRWGYLARCLADIRRFFPDCKVIVADNSFDDRCAAVARGCIRLESDSGLTACRNATVRATTTPYWFCGCEDFDFGTRGFRSKLEEAAAVLDGHPEISLVGGRANNFPYEAFLEQREDDHGRYMQEMPMVPSGAQYDLCDLVVNAFLARTSVLLECPWDEEVKPIGGEHGQFFWTLKQAGHKVAYLKDWNIRTLNLGEDISVQDPRYRQWRNRAVDTGHRIMCKKLGIYDWKGV